MNCSETCKYLDVLKKTNVVDPDRSNPYQSEELEPDPGRNSKALETQNRAWMALNTYNEDLEAQNGALEGLRPVFANFHLYEEKLSPDPDQHQSEKLYPDPDPHWSKKLDPDPDRQSDDSDPQHCKRLSTSHFSSYSIYMVLIVNEIMGTGYRT